MEILISHANVATEKLKKKIFFFLDQKVHSLGYNPEVTRASALQSQPTVHRLRPGSLYHCKLKSFSNIENVGSSAGLHQGPQADKSLSLIDTL